MPSVGASEDLSVAIAKRIRDLIAALEDVDASRVFFARAYEIVPDEMPCWDIEIGPDLPLDPDGVSMSKWSDSELTIYVDLYHAANDASGMEEVGYMRALSHKAILSDYRLGFGESGPVTNARYGGAAEPASDEESGLPGWAMRCMFPVNYRFNQGDRTIYTG